MDPRERADALLARARARGAFVVTPENAVSPMDAASTQQLPRIVVDDNDERRDPDATVVVPVPDVQRQQNVPAIAQESFTDVVGAPPGIRSRQQRIEDARARGAARKPREQEPEGKPESQEVPEEPPTTGSLSQRLEG
jgi:hypothetical protein